MLDGNYLVVGPLAHETVDKFHATRGHDHPSPSCRSGSLQARRSGWYRLLDHDEDDVVVLLERARAGCPGTVP